MFQWKNSFLAHERLAIIDPASGDQPLFNEDRCVPLVLSSSGGVAGLQLAAGSVGVIGDA